MKRAPTSSSATQGDPQPTAKRTKASQACASCRKHKTRCEILNEWNGTQFAAKCHRCKVLNLECSFQSSGGAIRITPQTIVKPNQSSEDPFSFSLPSKIVPCSILIPAEGISLSRLTFLNWTATPMTSIRELTYTKALFPSPDLLPIPDSVSESLEDILSPNQIQSLLQLFHHAYQPWLAYEPILDGTPTLFLDAARCLIASSHLDAETRSNVAPRLHRLVERLAKEQIYAPPSPLAFIQASQILALWAPITPTDSLQPKDPRLVIASSVSTAVNMNLSSASGRVNKLKKEKRAMPAEWNEQLDGILDEEVRRTHLFASVLTTELMLCLGTGRRPLSVQSETDYQAIDTSLYTTLASCRETRLGLRAKLYRIAEGANDIRLIGIEDLPRFHEAALQMLLRLDLFERMIAPYPVVSPFERDYFRVLHLQFHGCRLLVLHHFLQELRTAHAKTKDDKSFFHGECQGTFIVTVWGRDALASAEATLTQFLALPLQPQMDLISLTSSSPFSNFGHAPNIMSFMPDHIFMLLTLASTWLLVPNMSTHAMHNSHLGDVAVDLVRMTMTRLESLALSDDHAPARCANFLRALISAWENLNGNPKLCPPGVPHTNLKPTTRATNSTHSLQGSASGAGPSTAVQNSAFPSMPDASLLQVYSQPGADIPPLDPVSSGFSVLTDNTQLHVGQPGTFGDTGISSMPFPFSVDNGQEILGLHLTDTYQAPQAADENFWDSFLENLIGSSQSQFT